MLNAHPEWREWLEDTTILSTTVSRGAGKWRQDWTELAGGKVTGLEPALTALRCLKQREYLRLGLLDFAGFASLTETVEGLSNLADFCLETVLEVTALEMRRKFGEPGTSFLIVGMGKLGGQELNYSSDVDVIFLYGEDGDSGGRLTRQEYFSRLSQQITKAFAKQTPEGNLFRIDLRLRPEGDSGPIARSLDACENYYAGHGETWERLAMIKARRSAGEAGLAYDFEQLRTAFCFPRTFSPGIFAEIGQMKARIEREIVGAANMALHVKLGRGGIRDVEFIVQAFQVLDGARLPYLQQPSTLKALDALAELELLSREQVSQLAEGYTFWRMVEHRLQMRDDLQTHSLPRDADARAVIARSLGLEPNDFEEQTATHREEVRGIFEEVFGDQEIPEVFHMDTSFFPDPRSAERHLKALMPEAGRGSHASRRTQQSLEALERELDGLLRKMVVPEMCLMRFVRFVEAYGARGLLFESLVRNPKALELMLRVFDRSQFYTDVMVAHPEMFEDVVRRRTLDAPKSKSAFLAELHSLGGDHRDTSRTWRRGELLRIFLRDALGLAPWQELASEYTALAEACLAFAMEQTVPDGEPLLIIGMGKFGGKELFYGSDLDCLMVGPSSAADAGRDLNLYMGEIRGCGILFPMDFRLRPNGEGPICVSREATLGYYRDKAQPWEIQALTRARLVGGDPAEGTAFMAELEAVWRERLPDIDWRKEIAAMRQRIEAQRVGMKYPEGEFKTGAGGLIDVDFGVQCHLLEHAHREPSTMRGLDFLAKTHPKWAETWGEGYDFLRRVEAVLRADLNDAISKIKLGKGNRLRLARYLGYPDRESFLEQYDDVRRRVRRVYDKLLSAS